MALLIENEIVNYLKKNQISQTKDISKKFNLTPSTTRRYLILLEKRNVVKRKFGEIIYLEKNNIFDSIAKENINKNIPIKKEIAKTAAVFAIGHKTIFLDSGSSCYYLLDYLEKDIIIYTNSLINAEKAVSLGFHVNIFGGILKSRTMSIINVDKDLIRKIKFPISFFGVNGISNDEKLTTPERNEGMFKQLIANQSNCMVVLCEKEKIGLETFYNFTPDDNKKIIVISNLNNSKDNLKFLYVNSNKWKEKNEK